MSVRVQIVIVLCVILSLVAVEGAETIDATSPAVVTRDTSFLVDFDDRRFSAEGAAAGTEPTEEGGTFVDGRFGRGLRLRMGERLSYEAKDRLDLNRGTWELWVNEGWGPRQRGSSHHLVSHPLDWMARGNMRLWYWATSETSGVLRFDCHAIAPHGNGYITASWPGPGWHHLAARWDLRDGIALYIDGRKVAEQRGTWPSLPPSQGRLVISHAEYAADAVIDGIRVRRMPTYAADEPRVRAATGVLNGPTATEPQRAILPLHITNRRLAPFNGRLAVTVRDYFGNAVGHTDEALKLNSYAEHATSVTFVTSRPCTYFRVLLQVRDGSGAAQVDREVIVTTGALAGPRKAVCLDGAWECADGTWGSFLPPKTGWRTLLLPRREARLPTHLRWYRRRFAIPKGFGAQVRLVAEHVKQRARWWVNGTEVGESEYAYVPYSFDITGVVRRDATNEILVAVLDWVESTQPELQARLATTHPTSGRTIEGKPLIKPSGGEVIPAGIIESVWVYGHGAVWTSDIAVTTSVREKTISVRGTLHNETGEPAQCRVRNVVFDGGTRVLDLPLATIDVPGGETRAFEVSAPWAEPRMWWPDDPHMSRLETIASVNGSDTDAISTRFGFRELRAEGDTFLLNETPIHLFATSSWPNCVPLGWPGQVRDRWHATKVLFRSIKESGHRIFRAHTEPWSDRLADVCDEVGLLLATEGIMSSIPGRYNWDHPDTMEHFKRFCALWPRRAMNHPSLVIRSIENEIGYLLRERNMQKESISRVYEGYLECGRIVKAADPSRLIMYEGSGPAFYDVADVYNNHYPGDEYRWGWYPNAAYWPGRLMDCYTTKNWRWDRKKPLYVGEWGWFPGGRDNFAAYIGPSLYGPTGTYGWAKSVLWTMGIEGMRYHGISGICPWTALQGARYERITDERPRHRAVREGFAPLKVAIRERGSIYFAGDELTRTVSAYNDTLESREMTVRWRLAVEGREIDSGRWTQTVPPAGTMRRTILVRLPDGTGATRDGAVEADLRVGGKDVSSAQSRFRLFPHATTEHALTLAAIGLPSPTRQALQARGVDVRVVSANDLPDLAIPVLVGSEADLGTEDAQILRDLVSGGGQLVVLRQTQQPDWLPLQIDLVTNEPCTRFFVAWAGSPLLSGLMEPDFSFWPEDHIVSSTAWRRPEGARYRPVVSGGVGLDLSPLAEVRIGAGRVWLVQFPIWAAAPVNPVVERLGHTLLGELRAYRGQAPQALGLVAARHGGVEGLLRDAGARPFPLAGKLTSLDLDEYACILVDAEPEMLAETMASASRLRAFVAEGGTAWIHRVRPETVEAVATLCGRAVQIQSRFDLPLIMRDHVLTSGMTEAQVFWSATPDRFAAAKSGTLDHVVEINGGLALTDPPGVVELPHGAGRFLVDQLRWDVEFHDRRRACEYVATLCANLGVELAPTERAARAVTFLTHFDGTANAEYAAGAATATTPSPLNFADGKFGKAVDFGGAGELRYERRLNLDVDTGSLELWYRGTADSDQMLFRTTPEAFNDADFIALWIWQGMLRVDHHSLPGGPGTGFLVHILDLVEGWHHIAATWDNRSGVVLYLDGRQVAEQDGTWKSTEPRFRHFALSADHRPVVGAVDEVRILNYAADAEQIAADAAASMPFEAPAPGAEEWVPGMAPPVAP